MRHEDSQWLDELVREFGRARRTPKSITAAVISKPYLVLTTLRRRETSVVADGKRSAVFELGDRSAADLQAFSRRVLALTNRHGVREIFLRSHSENGQYVGHALNFKIEAALQLAGLKVTFVNTNSVSSWLRRDDPRLPYLPELGQGSRVAQLHLKAVETALFVGEHFGLERYFSDGSARDG